MLEEAYIVLKRNVNVRGDSLEGSEGSEKNGRESFCCPGEHMHCHEQNVGEIKLKEIRGNCISRYWTMVEG